MSLLKIIKKVIKRLFVPLCFVNKVIPKDRKRVFFYSNLGFRDNVKAMYDYFIENEFNKEYKIVVSTNDWKKYKKCAPQNVKFIGLSTGIFSFLVSGFCFYSFGKYPILPSKKQTVVNLWHGMPLKAVGRLEKGHENDKQDYFTYTIATSPFFAEIMAKAFGVTKDRVIITPQPKSDVFLQNKGMPNEFAKYSKVIFWLPTYRTFKAGSGALSSLHGSGENSDISSLWGGNAELLSELSEVLKNNNAALIIKPHPMDDISFSSLPSNVVLADQNYFDKLGMTEYDMLKHSDALVTDYSSIFFDYYMLDRPIGFITPDFDEYAHGRGFVVNDAADLMVGTHIKNTKEFKEFVCDVLDGKDEHREQRKFTCKLCNSFENTSGCERILNQINFLKTEEN